ncbi:hypothetical protein L596_011072 [Steinernema carpocapsae]|uniref:dolichyl-phosphate beta-glucosyltransferase n=1 Tax=Steinernema carpocapsae TaxID=34508 RepID=A0A4U5NT65_STECR|nr:hypothetical protein L596_011072 [Steinernema carpocapsae]
MDECLAYLEKRSAVESKFTYEVIVVDDGSKDTTANTAYAYSERYSPEKIRVLKLAKNVGKGGAVRNGVLCARGSLILFADADGATTFSEFGTVEKELHRLTNSGSKMMAISELDWTYPAICVGSRAHLEKQSMAERSLSRTILMLGFHSLVYVFGVRTIRDTQCGFKLFTRGAASKLFPLLHIERWAFDVELLFLAEHYHIPIAECGVQWEEKDGSKIVPVWSWLQMGRDLVLIWFRYATGIWQRDSISP